MSVSTLIQFITVSGFLRLVFLAGLLVIPVNASADVHITDNNARFQLESMDDCRHEMAKQDINQLSQSGTVDETGNCCANCDMPECATPVSASGHGLIITSVSPCLLLATDLVRVPAGTLPLTVRTDTPKRPPRL
ncbi:MAG: hypothetical protein COW29_08665 [Rhodobacterales bacterium CG15_BIG_FIL_POST_REV_8_21_14_020_59_13]|nr:MAG: hypothetical protein COW29_08665 [Rhodobacterales bacterium CG15_BIG_FIL_POST_REV_8_21_14_020_59_13]